VATLLGLGAGLAQAEFLGRRVTRELARAICLVGDGDCRRDQEPCVNRSDSDRSTWSGAIALLRAGHDRFALVERRSDGTYAVTVARALQGGAEASAGLHVDAHVAGIDVTAGGAITASLLARLDDGETWIARSPEEAAAIMQRGGATRPPDLTSTDRAWLGSVGATVGADALLHLDAAGASLTFDQHWGTTTDHRTGRRTVYVEASSAGTATALGGVLGLSTTGGEEIYAVELSATGRPLALRVTATGAFDGSRDLPSVVQPVAGLLSTPPTDGRRYEITASLDLADPHALAAASDLLDAIAHKRGRATPTHTLRTLLDERGTIEARVLTSRSSASDTGIEATIPGAKLGLHHATEQRTQQLLAATSRGLDGQWITRTDCVT
ncbi:MAG TPA: hypothetical protein VNT55_01555, partial [Baekduia sp.]|nr:hypothetical protein [Baekduia sp.]